jgi:hypothetical protein
MRYSVFDTISHKERLSWDIVPPFETLPAGREAFDGYLDHPQNK